MALDDGDAFRARRARRASAGTDCGVTHSSCDLSAYLDTLRHANIYAQKNPFYLLLSPSKSLHISCAA